MLRLDINNVYPLPKFPSLVKHLMMSSKYQIYHCLFIILLCYFPRKFQVQSTQNCENMENATNYLFSSTESHLTKWFVAIHNQKHRSIFFTTQIHSCLYSLAVFGKTQQIKLYIWICSVQTSALIIKVSKPLTFSFMILYRD